MVLEDAAKRAVGSAAVDQFVRNDTCVGLGTGTTAYWAVERVGERVAQGMRIRAVATSVATEIQCSALGIPLVDLGSEPIDVALDGADEAAPDRSLIKGAGGALFREKAVALAASRFIAIVTERKLVSRLGRSPLPVEVVPFSLEFVANQIASLGAEVNVRFRDGLRYATDNGNAILDCAFGAIDDPPALEVQLRALHGVVGTGLFVGLTSQVLVGKTDGSIAHY